MSFAAAVAGLGSAATKLRCSEISKIAFFKLTRSGVVWKYGPGDLLHGTEARRLLKVFIHHSVIGKIKAERKEI